MSINHPDTSNQPNGRNGLLGSVAFLVVAVAAILLIGNTRIIGGHPTIYLPGANDPISWEQCHFTAGFSEKIPADTQCGFLGVPIDYHHPHQGTARIALIRFPATKKRLGSLIINPGGPGESGLEAALSLYPNLPRSIREQFDLVGFDPRGVGSSVPAIHCNTDADVDRLRALNEVDYSQAGVAAIEQQARDYVARCIDKNGKEFLANVGTHNVVQDLDRLRDRLGDPQLNYLGYSYGTRIGAAYAEEFPHNIRTMVLDGAVDPNIDSFEDVLRQSEAFQKAFDDYAAACATRKHCPLGHDPSHAVAVYHQLVDPLVEHPVKTHDGRELSYSDAIVGTIMALYSPDFWPPLTKGLRMLKHGHGDMLLKLADLYMRRDSRGHYSNATDARTAINCVDQPPITNEAKVIEQDRQLRKVAPFMAYGHFTGHAPRDTCAFWPVPPTSTPHTITVTDLVPILVVSTTHDPATPYQSGVDLAHQLHGRLLTFNGTQHTVVFEGDHCIDHYVSRYLLYKDLPPLDAHC